MVPVLKCTVFDIQMMTELTFHGLDIGRVDPNDDLVDRVVETTTEEYPLADGDVVVVTAKAAFESVDETLEYASRSLGKGRWATARNVTLPLAGPGILAGVTLAFARSIGEFGATMMLSYYPRTMPVEIWVSFVSLGLDSAYPVAILLVAISVAALLVLNTVARNPWR